MAFTSAPAANRDHSTLTLTPEELRTGACVLSPEVVSRLCSVLEEHRSTLCRDLGLSLDGPVDHELWAWCRRPGSTLFVLASLLEKVSRPDCLTWIHQDLEQHLMPLHLVIEGAPPGVGLASDSPIDGAPMRQQFQQICTNSQFSLRQALENVLSDELSRFHIIEPGSWVTWDTVASNLRGRQLTLRYASDSLPHGVQAAVAESQATRVKQLDVSRESTDLKELLVHKDRTLGSQTTFVKELTGAWSPTPADQGMVVDGQQPTRDGSMTLVKQVYDGTEEDFMAEETSPKLTGDFETFVKAVYLDETDSGSQEGSINAMMSYSENTTPMDSSVQREGMLGLSDSVIAHDPGTFHNINLDTFNDRCITHCSNATCKFSMENIHKEVSDTKPMPDKHMPRHQLQGLDSDDPKGSCSVDTPPSESNSGLDYLTTGQQTAGGSVDSLLPVEGKRNNLNCISVSTAPSLFKANRLDSPCKGTFSMAEKAQLGFPVTPDGEKSLSNNQILDDELCEDKDRVDTGAGDDDHMVVDGGDSCMEVSELRQSEHQTLVKSVPDFGASSSDSCASSTPPLKRQKSAADSPGVQTAAVTPAGGTIQPLEAQPELDSEMIGNQQHHTSFSFSQDPSHGLLPPKGNPFRYTPPPPYLVKDPPLQQPPPYSSVSHPAALPPQQELQFSACQNTSIPQASRSSQTLFSNPKNSYTNVPGHISAPAELRSQPVRAPSSAHYMTMEGPDPPTTLAQAMGPPPHTQVRLRHNQGTVPRFILGNQPFSSPLRQGAHGNVLPGAIVQPVNVPQPRSVRQSLPATSSSRPQMAPFQPAPLVTPAARQIGAVTSQGHGAAAGRMEPDPESEHYVYPDQARADGVGGAAGGRPRIPQRSRVSLADELRELPGWCPDVNGDNVQGIMQDYLQQDGAFIIWQSRRYRKFVITVSHQGQLIHLLVQERPPRSRDGGPVYYLFENELMTDSILGLYRHYRQTGIQVSITSQQGRQHREHIYLRGPVSVKFIRRRRQ